MRRTAMTDHHSDKEIERHSEREIERDFEKLADSALTELRVALDGLEIDAEVELTMGILSIEFPDGAKYIINSHRAAKQIWMAAERNAWHFDPRSDGRWVASKSGDEMWTALSRVLTRKLGKDTHLGPQ